MRPFGRLVAAAVATTLVLGGCGSASEPSPPTGIDELVIPSPSLDPSDFVAGIDNPWLPLVPGTTWRYRTNADGRVGTLTVTVLDESRDVAGVTATIVRTEVVDDRGRSVESESWFAQDADGNVWSLGKEGTWEAGTDGGEAGLAMAAHPRVGDGYRTEFQPGVAEGRAMVTGVDGSASVPYGDLTGLLEIEASSTVDPGVELLQYAKGIGLVRELTVPDGDEQVELVAVEQP